MDTETKIQELLDKNRVEDLDKFLKNRECCNNFNTFLMYFFHVVQTAGILTTTVAAGYNMKEIIWLGATLNALAALIHVFEKLNEGRIKQYGRNIKAIKDNNYLDEETVAADDDNASHPPPPPPI